jgi:hypothetical protein
VAPFQETMLPLTNPPPLIWRVKAGEPAATLAGETVVMAGGEAGGVCGVLGGGVLLLEPASVPPPQPETSRAHKQREAEKRKAQNRL